MCTLVGACSCARHTHAAMSGVLGGLERTVFSRISGACPHLMARLLVARRGGRPGCECVRGRRGMLCIYARAANIGCACRWAQGATTARSEAAAGGRGRGLWIFLMLAPCAAHARCTDTPERLRSLAVSPGAEGRLLWFLFQKQIFNDSLFPFLQSFC